MKKINAIKFKFYWKLINLRNNNCILAIIVKYQEIQVIYNILLHQKITIYKNFSKCQGAR